MAVLNPASARRNARVLLVQGAVVGLAVQLASVTVVLPFLCVALGGSYFTAAMLLPLYTTGSLLGALLAPQVVGVRGTSRGWLVLGSLIKAGLVAGIAVLATTLHGDPFEIDLVFALMAAATGLVVGVRGIAFMDVIGDAVDGTVRSSLLFWQNAASGILSVIVALVIAALFESQPGVGGHIAMQWVASAVLIVAALLPLLLASSERRPQPRRAGAVREGLRLLTSESWFRRFLLAQALLLCVAFCTTFFSAHAARVHSTEDTIGLLVAFTGAGTVVGALLWTRVLRRFGFRALFVTGAAVTILAAVVDLVGDDTGLFEGIWFDGIIILLATQGGQAVLVGRHAYLLAHVSAEQRAAVSAFTQVAIGAASALAAVGLGALGSIESPDVAVGILIGLLTLAGVSALFLREPHHAKT